MFNGSLSLHTFLFFLVPSPFLPPPPSPLPIFSSLTRPLLPFLSSFLQEPDLCYLVENIWGGQSALSAVQELFELVLGSINIFTVLPLLDYCAYVWDPHHTTYIN